MKFTFHVHTQVISRKTKKGILQGVTQCGTYILIQSLWGDTLHNIKPKE